MIVALGCFAFLPQIQAGGFGVPAAERVLSRVHHSGRMQCASFAHHRGRKHRASLVLALFRRRRQLQHRCWRWNIHITREILIPLLAQRRHCSTPLAHRTWPLEPTRSSTMPAAASTMVLAPLCSLIMTRADPVLPATTTLLVIPRFLAISTEPATALLAMVRFIPVLSPAITLPLAVSRSPLMTSSATGNAVHNTAVGFSCARL